MKLRNKKTGEINNFNLELNSEVADNIKLIKTGLNYMQAQNDEEYIRYYSSLSDFNEEWEDYTPAEPLIKDEKIRKAVRAWAEAIKTKSAFVEKPSFERADLILTANFKTISFSIDKPKELNFCEIYTIEELCGEKEE